MNDKKVVGMALAGVGGFNACNQAAFGFLGRRPGEQRRHVIPGEDKKPRPRRNRRA